MCLQRPTAPRPSGCGPTRPSFNPSAWALSAIILALLVGPARGQTPGDAELNQAYRALIQKDYDAAITAFHQGLAKQPSNAGAHKDLAYTLLKTGDDTEARDQFEAAMKLNPKDEVAALEFSFLAFETQKPIAARRMFNQLRKSSNPQTRATAEQAFQNIDQPLAASIARWQQALQRTDKPNDISMFSAHWELAQTAELRDELPLAAEQFAICHQLKPQLSEILLILARVWRELGRAEDANAALLAASRSPDSRTAEQALETMGPMQKRYPYPYEFVAALKLDPGNLPLRKELAYLYVAMHHDGEAISQFEQILTLTPTDQAVRNQLNALKGIKTSFLRAPPSALRSPPSALRAPPSADAKEMGMKSYALGYTSDAIKYLTEAHQFDPNDMQVILKLAWAFNQANRNEDAITYFMLARKAPDPKIAAEAAKAYHTLHGDVLPQTTIWSLPMYSTRWHDLFTYAQIKRSLPIPGLNGFNKIVTFYLSTRFMGDVKSATEAGTFGAQYLSESSFIFGVGASTRTWHHITGWVEAGESVNYLPGRTDLGKSIPDYRGGANFAKGFGQLLGSQRSGLFYETTADAIYVSRFDKDWLFYSQHRAGRTFHLADRAKFQLLANANYVRDIKEQYWANTLEFGPGLKFHPPFLAPNVYFSADFLRGVYLNNFYWPHPPNYYDLRLSFWYARTK
jgi:tetratricopeptide (TPR) repeat protein